MICKIHQVIILWPILLMIIKPFILIRQINKPLQVWMSTITILVLMLFSFLAHELQLLWLVKVIIRKRILVLCVGIEHPPRGAFLCKEIVAHFTSYKVFKRPPFHREIRTLDCWNLSIKEKHEWDSKKQNLADLPQNFSKFNNFLKSNLTCCMGSDELVHRHWRIPSQYHSWRHLFARNKKLA